MKRDHPYSIVVEGDNGVVKGLQVQNLQAEYNHWSIVCKTVWLDSMVALLYIGSLTWESSGKSVANRVQTIAEVSTNLV